MSLVFIMVSDTFMGIYIIQQNLTVPNLMRNTKHTAVQETDKKWTTAPIIAPTKTLWIFLEQFGEASIPSHVICRDDSTLVDDFESFFITSDRSVVFKDFFSATGDSSFDITNTLLFLTLGVSL